MMCVQITQRSKKEVILGINIDNKLTFDSL